MVVENQFVQSLTKDLLGIYLYLFIALYFSSLIILFDCLRKIFYIISLNIYFRYMSMCHLVQHMKDIGMHQRILHVQKGDCADASKYLI